MSEFSTSSVNGNDNDDDDDDDDDEEEEEEEVDDDDNENDVPLVPFSKLTSFVGFQRVLPFAPPQKATLNVRIFQNKIPPRPGNSG